ncbi:MAG: hypothetical protein MZU95_02400 [Desulfomicrobium escambiense]|nr:hypothetical protein [Desulfomicrobium escambiense]
MVYAQTLNELIERNPDVFCLEADLGKADAIDPRGLQAPPAQLHQLRGPGSQHDRGRGRPGQGGQDPLLRHLHRLRHPPLLRPDHHQRRLRQQQREDRRHLAGHHPGPERRHAHVLPGSRHHARHAQHARLQPGGRQRAARGHVPHGRQPAADLHAAGAAEDAQALRGRLPLRPEPGQAPARGPGRDPGRHRLHDALRPGRRPRSSQTRGSRSTCCTTRRSNPSTRETLIDSAQKTGAVVTVENQNIVGGLGSAVCEVLSEQHPVRVKRLGIPDQFGEVADQDYLFNKHGFGPEHIAQACRELARATTLRNASLNK